VLTSVIRDFKEQGEAERALTVKQNAALAADMQKAIIVAIQDGEAKAKAVADRSRAHLVAAENSMLDEYETNVYTEFARKAPNGTTHDTRPSMVTSFGKMTSDSKAVMTARS